MDIPINPAPEPEEDLSPAWPQHLPELTYWPVVMASGLFALFLGLITSWIVSLAGLGVIGLSMAGWISDVNQ